MISWEQWHSLLAAARHGTFAKAATILSIDATTLGRRLKALEQQLGYDLFLRKDGQLYPTQQCEALLTHIETADDALRSAMQLSSDSDVGSVWREIRMTVPPFLANNLIAPAIADLTRRRSIRVELIATSSSATLTRREADISIRIEDRPQEFKIDYKRIKMEKLGTLKYSVYAGDAPDPENLPWAGLPETHLATTGSKIMSKLVGKKGMQYKTRHFDTLKKFVASGPARALLPDIVARDCPNIIPLSDTVLEQPLWMLYHHQDTDVPHLRATREWLSSIAKAQLV
jgi:DNA-binding transcriptional LysR family regulator